MISFHLISRGNLICLSIRSLCEGLGEHVTEET